MIKSLVKNLCTPIILAKIEEAKIFQPSQSSGLINDKQAIIINFYIYRVILISSVQNVLYRAGSEDKYSVLNKPWSRELCARYGVMEGSRDGWWDLM